MCAATKDTLTVNTLTNGRCDISHEFYSILYSLLVFSSSINIFRFYLNELPFSLEVTEENHVRTEEKEEVPSVLPLLLQ